MNWTDNTFWVIRSAGERTTTACRDLIAAFVPEERIRIIQEKPFSRAIRKTYELGRASGLKWTVCIDADVFIHREGFRELVALAETVPESVWYVQGLTIDKFIPIIRTAGTGIYRNARVEEAMQHIPEDGTSLRPETTTMQGMIREGHVMHRTPIVVGMHDFEQSYVDIARKTFLHTQKHHVILAEMESYWQREAPADSDFAAALLGMRLGDGFVGQMAINKDFMVGEITTALGLIGLLPKKPLAPDAITPQYVDRFLTEFRTDEGLQRRKFPTYREHTIMARGTPRQRRLEGLYGGAYEVLTDWSHRLGELGGKIR